MVELVMTDEERDLPWSALSDADISTIARHTLMQWDEYHRNEGTEAMAANSAALYLIRTAIQVNSETFDINLQGVTIRDKPEGDWDICITVKRSGNGVGESDE